MPQAVLILTDTSDGGVAARIILSKDTLDKHGIQHLSGAQDMAMGLFQQLCPDEAPDDVEH